MARARAAAEWAEEARAGAATVTSPAIARKTSPVPTLPSRQPNFHEPEPLPPWPGTEPYNDSWADKSEVAPQVMSPLQKKLAVARRTPPRALPSVTQPAATPAAIPAATPSARSTVIPVPQLPAAADPRSVRPAAYTPMQPRGRVARGTPTPGGKLEETVRTLAAPPVHDDRTSPYITLPNEVKPSGFAHTKRVAAKER